jgi:hypothetical protein
MREVDALVYTEEEVNLDRLEKHIFVWKMDLEGTRGSKSALESMLAERLMRESALLMRTLRTYAADEGSVVSTNGSLRTGLVAGSYTPPQPAEMEMRKTKSTKKSVERRNGAAWAGGVMEEENSVRRTKRNVFGDILHQLFGVATDEQLQQQLRVDEEMRGKVADTLTRQVYFEKELTMAIGNITEEEDRIESRMRTIEENHNLDRDRGMRMNAHRFTLMEDVDRLEDILEAVVSGAVNTRHAAYLSAKAGLSRVASFEYLNITRSANGVVIRYLTRLFKDVHVDVVSTSASVIQLRSPSREYFLHTSHGPEMSLTELEVQGTRDDCSGCALLVHTGNRRYLVVEDGNLTCVSSVQPVNEVHVLTTGEVLAIERGEECKNRRMRVSSEGRHVTHYVVSASGVDPLDSLVLRRRERVDQKLDGSHSIVSSHSALNMHLRQNVGMAQQDIENLITETQESFKLYTVTSSGTAAWLGVITVLAVILIALIVRKLCQKRRERMDDTVFIPSLP